MTPSEPTARAAPHIRNLAESERDLWLPLWRAYQRFYKVDIADEVSEMTWRRLIDPVEPMWAALAFDGGRAVGLVHWLAHRSTWTAGDYMYLQDLYVVEAARGRGAGRALIERVYRAAEARGAARVYWLTHETNTDAMALYDRVATRSGFVQYRKII